MNGIGVSAVTAYTAHREWATRPADERYDSVSALHAAACARRNRLEERTIETRAFRTETAPNDALVLHDASDRPAALTHWSFEQLATIAGAPPKYLRTLPAAIASSAINYGLQRQRRDEHQLLADHAAPWTVHAITSSRYARIHHDELASRVLGLMALHPAWHLPLGYKGGVYGAERVASGAYLALRLRPILQPPLRASPEQDAERRVEAAGRSRHVPVPRGRQPRSRRPNGRIPRRPVPRVHPPEQ